MSGQQSDMEFPHHVLVGSRKKAGKTALPRVTRQMRVKDIVVTQDDIDKSTRENSHSCMIAEAIKRCVPGVKNVSVDIQSIRFTDTKNKRRVSFLTPEICQLGLVRFDRGVPVKPFTFSMRSVQVTAATVTVPKLDENGEPVLRTVNVKGSVRKDGSRGPDRVRSIKSTKSVVTPTAVKSLVTGAARPDNPARFGIVGGKLPPKHKPSFHRKFGVKAFTWDDDEDVSAVSARLDAAWGVEGVTPDAPDEEPSSEGGGDLV